MSTQDVPLTGAAPANAGAVTYDTPLGPHAYSTRDAIRTQITKLMLKGAGYAAVVFFGSILFVVALWGVSLLLPEASKQAPDPSLETTMLLRPSAAA